MLFSACFWLYRKSISLEVKKTLRINTIFSGHKGSRKHREETKGATGAHTTRRRGQGLGRPLGHVAPSPPPYVHSSSYKCHILRNPLQDFSPTFSAVASFCFEEIKSGGMFLYLPKAFSSTLPPPWPCVSSSFRTLRCIAIARWLSLSLIFNTKFPWATSHHGVQPDVIHVCVCWDIMDYHFMISFFIEFNWIF